MNEKEKLKEAKYFYRLMSKNAQDKENFNYNLSAFATASRSILQYAIEEASSKPGGQRWYANYISNNRVLGFFKNKRDINIHVLPINSKLNAKVNNGGELILKSSLLGKVIKSNGSINDLGELKNSIKENNQPSKSKERKPTKIMYKYYFNDWPGTEDVMSLCKIYLKKLENLIRDGIRKGFITG